MTIGADISHIWGFTLMTLGSGSHIMVVDSLMTLGEDIFTYYWWLNHFNDIRGRYITYYWGWITLMTLGADILHIIEVGSL